MTNPGHIDPGYVGRMRFAVINMGRQEYMLRRGEAIITTLLVRLSAPAHRNWLQRRGGNPAGSPTQENLDRLSADFMGVDRRAKKAVDKAELRIKALQWLAPIIVAFATIGGGYLTLIQTTSKDLEDVRRQVEVLKTSLDVSKIKSVLDFQ